MTPATGPEGAGSDREPDDLDGIPTADAALVMWLRGGLAEQDAHVRDQLEAMLHAGTPITVRPALEAIARRDPGPGAGQKVQAQRSLPQCSSASLPTGKRRSGTCI